MKTIKLVPLLTAFMIVVLLASCGPGYVTTGANYGPRPYYGYGYNNPYGYARPYGYYPRPVIVRPPVAVRPRYYTPAPRYNNNGSSARRSYNNGYSNGGRSRGPR